MTASAEVQQSDDAAFLGVDYDEVVGYSTVYALILALSAYTKVALFTDTSPGIGLAMASFFVVLVVIMLVNVAARATGVAAFVASRGAQPFRLNLALSFLLAVGWLLW